MAGQCRSSATVGSRMCSVDPKKAGGECDNCNVTERVKERKWRWLLVMEV